MVLDMGMVLGTDRAVGNMGKVLVQMLVPRPVNLLQYLLRKELRRMEEIGYLLGERGQNEMVLDTFEDA